MRLDWEHSNIRQQIKLEMIIDLQGKSRIRRLFREGHILV
jgi:hypothetical protein